MGALRNRKECYVQAMASINQSVKALSEPHTGKVKPHPSTTTLTSARPPTRAWKVVRTVAAPASIVVQ